MEWRNRIVESGTAEAGTLMPNPRNWRRHPAVQQAALSKGLQGVGWVQSVVVNRRTGRLLDGHLRVALALEQGTGTAVPVNWVELTEEEETAVLVTLDPIAGMATTDEETLLANVRSLDGTDFAAMVADVASILGVDGTGAAVADPGPQVDKAGELQAKWGTATGQLWELGEHRLICGDCTDGKVVAAIAPGGSCDLWLTDPPYAVGYADKNRYLNAIARGNRIQVPIVNDHLSLEDATAVWKAAALNALDACADHASYYWFACQGGDQMMMMMMTLSEVGWRVRHELIWVKNNHVLGRTDYNYKHEPILYGWKKDGRHRFFGGFQTSVLEFPKPQQSDLHPTTKPVELVERLISNSTEAGQIVLDTFLGSGTTLIACERLGRRCRAVEIEPGYVAVALERWAVATGGAPRLVAGEVLA